MRGFEFLSAGIRVVFRGDQLFLSPVLLAEFEDKYVGRVSERTMQSMLVMAQNEEALRERATMHGGFGASFNSWTSYLPTEELEERWQEVVENSHVYLRRVRKITGGCLAWVVEFGRKGGRVHGHFVSDRWMNRRQQTEAKTWRNSLMGRCHMTELGEGGYMWKEMGKAVGRRGTGKRLMGCMGDFVGRCGMKDFVLDSPMAECRRLAWGMREQSLRHRESYRVTWDKARQLFGLWLAGKLSLGEDYDRYRETMSGFEPQKVGDAWEGEDQSLDAGFDVSQLEGGESDE
jgi:hypothetical protein